MYRKKYSVVCLLLLVLSCLLSACGNGKSEKYDEAISLMDNNNYNEAIEILTELSDYEDSSAKLLECKYALGQEAITTEEWETAISYFTDLNYKDSNELLAKCEKEKGMHENADYDFLADLEKSVLSRIDTVKSTDYLEEIVVDTELAYVGKYANAIFYDSTLKSLADKYIEGLNVQKDSLKKEYFYQQQLEWLRGITIRYEALSELYNDYGFLSDNAEFIATYVSQVDNQKALYNAYCAIEEDISAQINSDDFSWYIGDNEVSFTLKNNTEYEFTTTFELSFYDANNVMYESGSDTIENIKPGTSYSGSIYIYDENRLDGIGYQNYYSNVR